MKLRSLIAIIVTCLAMVSMAVSAGTTSEGPTSEPSRVKVENSLEALKEVLLVRGAKTNGYTVKDLGIDGIEVTCQGVAARPLNSDAKYGTAGAGYTATATAKAEAQGSVNIGPDRVIPAEGVTASTDTKEGRVESAPKGKGLTAPALVQGTVEVRAEAVAEGNARVSSGLSSLVSSGIVTVSQKVEFKDGNATFRLCYANLKSITVVLGK